MAIGNQEMDSGQIQEVLSDQADALPWRQQNLILVLTAAENPWGMVSLG